MTADNIPSPLPILPDTPFITFARIISRIFSPPLVSIAGGLVAAAWLGTSQAWLSMGLMIVPSVLIPVAYVLMLMKQGKVSDFDVFVRKQRWRPYLVTLLSSIGILTIAFFANAPSLFLILGAASLIQTSLLFLINSLWKISGHCASVSGFVIVCWSLLGGWAILTFSLIPAIIWSRVILKRHSFLQAVAGVILGCTLFTFAMHFVT